MGIFDFLKKPSYETTDELLALEGKKRNDWIVIEFARLLEERMLLIGKKKMTEEELTILAIEGLEAKVNNDGFYGFFAHSTKEYVPIIVDSLRRNQGN